MQVQEESVLNIILVNQEISIFKSMVNKLINIKNTVGFRTNKLTEEEIEALIKLNKNLNKEYE
jgi:hypothetical protein